MDRLSGSSVCFLLNSDGYFITFPGDPEYESSMFVGRVFPDFAQRMLNRNVLVRQEYRRVADFLVCDTYKFNLDYFTNDTVLTGNLPSCSSQLSSYNVVNIPGTNLLLVYLLDYSTPTSETSICQPFSSECLPDSRKLCKSGEQLSELEFLPIFDAECTALGFETDNVRRIVDLTCSSAAGLRYVSLYVIMALTMFFIV